MTFAVAGHVIGVVITSSPGPTPSARSDRCIAAVPEETATACFAPTYSANRRSSSAAFGPVVSQPERSVSATAAISSSPMAGGWKPRKVSLGDLDGGAGLNNAKAYASSGAPSACQRLLPALADGQHGAGAVGSWRSGRDLVARLAVHAHPGDAVARPRPARRRPPPPPCPPGRRGSARTRRPPPSRATKRLAAGISSPRAAAIASAVEIDAERRLAELRIVASAEPRRELTHDRAVLAHEHLRVRRAVLDADGLRRRPRELDGRLDDVAGLARSARRGPAPRRTPVARRRRDRSPSAGGTRRRPRTR